MMKKMLIFASALLLLASCATPENPGVPSVSSPENGLEQMPDDNQGTIYF